MRDLSEEEARRLWRQEREVMRKMADHQVDDSRVRNLMRVYLRGLQDKTIVDELVRLLTAVK